MLLPPWRILNALTSAGFRAFGLGRERSPFVLHSLRLRGSAQTCCGSVMADQSAATPEGVGVAGEGAGAEEKPKSAKQLKKEQQKKAKMEKFAEKKAKQAAEVGGTELVNYLMVYKPTGTCYIIQANKEGGGKEKKKASTKKVLSYDIPTPPGEKKGAYL